MGGVRLAGGQEAKVVTGIDDLSRFCVAAALVEHATARAVCSVLTATLERYGVPEELLTDNGKVFTGRFNPAHGEVLFERICREQGITQRLTRPYSPTTTGKVERFHKTLQAELLDTLEPFPSLQVAQQVISAWVADYNHHRPHQALAMRTPAQHFQPGVPRVAPPAPSASPPSPTRPEPTPPVPHRDRASHHSRACWKSGAMCTATASSALPVRCSQLVVTAPAWWCASGLRSAYCT